MVYPLSSILGWTCWLPVWCVGLSLCRIASELADSGETMESVDEAAQSPSGSLRSWPVALD